MGKTLETPKDIVRNRSEGLCEKCKRVLTPNNGGKDVLLSARSIHHRKPQSRGGRDIVVCMVNLCVFCHNLIHADEESAETEGWIVLRRDPARVPFHSWRGWVLPLPDGGLVLLDFDSGRATEIATPRARAKREPRPRRDRRKSKWVPQVA